MPKPTAFCFVFLATMQGLWIRNHMPTAVKGWRHNPQIARKFHLILFSSSVLGKTLTNFF